MLPSLPLAVALILDKPEHEDLAFFHLEEIYFSSRDVEV
jgi:hypothetical protein